MTTLEGGSIWPKSKRNWAVIPESSLAVSTLGCCGIVKGRYEETFSLPFIIAGTAGQKSKLLQILGMWENFVTVRQ